MNSIDMNSIDNLLHVSAELPEEMVISAECSFHADYRNISSGVFLLRWSMRDGRYLNLLSRDRRVRVPATLVTSEEISEELLISGADTSMVFINMPIDQIIQQWKTLCLP